ncbi:hypothetical protein EYF80_011097 [Liparis tanakae]|uniref:Uncharacterized protein n=1 Tax=Liparis tanakae TaxID=230148 RepID=A0A4Z2INF6_9TELE|nr:hypothetical protein EYF80_011097 [Liparis tanakae]
MYTDVGQHELHSQSHRRKRSEPRGEAVKETMSSGWLQVFNVWLSSHIWLFRLVSSQLISQLINARYRQRVSAAAASRSAAACDREAVRRRRKEPPYRGRARPNVIPSYLHYHMGSSSQATMR